MRPRRTRRIDFNDSLETISKSLHCENEGHFPGPYVSMFYSQWPISEPIRSSFFVPLHFSYSGCDIDSSLPLMNALKSAGSEIEESALDGEDPFVYFNLYLPWDLSNSALARINDSRSHSYLHFAVGPGMDANYGSLDHAKLNTDLWASDVIKKVSKVGSSDSSSRGPIFPKFVFASYDFCQNDKYENSLAVFSSDDLIFEHRSV